MIITYTNIPLLKKGYPALFWIASAGSDITTLNQTPIGLHLDGLKAFPGSTSKSPWKYSDLLASCFRDIFLLNNDNKTTC